jgi:hypothetical protein
MHEEHTDCETRTRQAKETPHGDLLLVVRKPADANLGRSQAQSLRNRLVVLKQYVAAAPSKCNRSIYPQLEGVLGSTNGEAAEAHRIKEWLKAAIVRPQT